MLAWLDDGEVGPPVGERREVRPLKDKGDFAEDPGRVTARPFLNGLTRTASETFQLIRERRAARAAALQRRGLPVATIARHLDLSARQTARYLATARECEPLT